MRLKRFAPALALLLLALPALAAPVTYPGSPATDAGGAAVTSGVTATVASVTDLDGNAKATSLAVPHVAGGNTSAVYDAANGEAWVTLTLSAAGHTFAPVTIFCSGDPSALLAINSQTARFAFDGGNNVKCAPQTQVSLAAAQAFSNSAASTVTPTWYVAPPALPGDFLSPQEQASLLAAGANTPAGVVAAIKADPVLARTFGRAYGKYAYSASTHVMSLLKDDGAPLLGADGVTPVTLTLTYDPTGVITGKQ